MHDLDLPTEARPGAEAARGLEAGVGFERGGFQELILVIEDLPF